MANERPTTGDSAQLVLHLLALLERLPQRARSEDVHQLRTTIRRLEVMLSDPPRKLAKALARMRREAGRVRDLDVHLDLIAEPLSAPASTPVADAQRALHRVLRRERRRHRRELRERVREAAPRLRRKLPALVEHDSPEPPTDAEVAKRIGDAREQFLAWSGTTPTDTEALHALRIDTKKLRYSLEPLRKYEAAQTVAAEFKRVQDAIGAWHDWATLESLAHEHLSSADVEALEPVLGGRVRQEYRRARRAVDAAHRKLTGGPRLIGSGKGGRAAINLRKAG